MHTTKIIITVILQNKCVLRKANKITNYKVVETDLILLITTILDPILVAAVCTLAPSPAFLFCSS